jgi:hypothetical protein
MISTESLLPPFSRSIPRLPFTANRRSEVGEIQIGSNHG